MNNFDLERFVSERTQTANQIIKNSSVIEYWQEYGAEVNLVGSVAMGLLCKHRDIDFHIYTATLEPATGFAVISKICQNPNIKRLSYNNLADTAEKCIEWHLWYYFQSEEWQLDLIQILKNSKFDGYFEHVAQRISQRLTPETRKTILELKYQTPESIHISGIEYYQAVIADGVRTYSEFQIWRKNHLNTGINLWCP